MKQKQVLTTEIKARAIELRDNGQWLKLAILILQFGIELIEYLKSNKKTPKKDETKD